MASEHLEDSVIVLTDIRRVIFVFSSRTECRNTMGIRSDGYMLSISCP